MVKVWADAKPSVAATVNTLRILSSMVPPVVAD